MNTLKHYVGQIFTIWLFVANLFGCSEMPDDPSNPTDNTLFDFEIEALSEPEPIPLGESVEIDFSVTGSGVSDLTFEIEASQGWSAEISVFVQDPKAGVLLTLRVTAPESEKDGEITVYAKHGITDEIKSAFVKVSSYRETGPEDPEDPYSTQNNKVEIKQTGFSQTAITVMARPIEDVDKYYFALLSEEKIYEYSVRIGEDWSEAWRNSVYNQLNATLLDYWSYGDDVYRFNDYIDHTMEESIPLPPDKYYYVYTVVVLNDGSLGDLELTRVKTLPKDNSPFIPTPATHVAVACDLTYDAVTANLKPDDRVYGYYFNLVDQHAVDDYIDIYGTKWDVGFLDKWNYYLKYEYGGLLSYGPENYTWSNLVPASVYYLFVVYFDSDAILNLELTIITTPSKDPVMGEPRVKVTERSRDESTATFLFEPNSDCGKYTVDIWSESDLDDWREKYGYRYVQELINYAVRYGRITEGTQLITLDINDFYPMASGSRRKWTDNKYDLVVLPFDKNGVYDETGITYTHIGHTGQGAPRYVNNADVHIHYPARLQHDDLKSYDRKLNASGILYEAEN